MSKNVFEQLGYGKYDRKPSYIAHSLVKTKEGWVVFEIKFSGMQVESINMLHAPMPRGMAIQQYRVLTAKSLVDQITEDGI